MALTSIFLAAVRAGKRPSILVVEDEPDIRSAIADLLETILGAKVESAGSGEQGLGLVRAGAFDLIVSDFKMPGMNGVEFLNQARVLAPETRFLLITAFERDLVEAMGDSFSPELVLYKPLQPQPLIDTIQRSLAAD